MNGAAKTDARHINLVWGTLVLATLGSFGVAEYLPHPLLAVAVFILIAAFKIRLILRHFMELKDGPLGLRVFFDLWTGSCAALIIGLCWFASA
jgi:hypothetical protein